MVGSAIAMTASALVDARWARSAAVFVADLRDGAAVAGGGPPAVGDRPARRRRRAGRAAVPGGGRVAAGRCRGGRRPALRDPGPGVVVPGIPVLRCLLSLCRPWVTGPVPAGPVCRVPIRVAVCTLTHVVEAVGPGVPIVLFRLALQVAAVRFAGLASFSWARQVPPGVGTRRRPALLASAWPRFAALSRFLMTGQDEPVGRGRRVVLKVAEALLVERDLVRVASTCGSPIRLPTHRPRTPLDWPPVPRRSPAAPAVRRQLRAARPGTSGPGSRH